METIRVDTPAELEQYKQQDGDYRVADSLIIECDIDITSSMFVDEFLFIEAGRSIRAGGSIKAGGFIEAGEYVFSFVFEIDTKTLSTRLLPFHRSFWAAMPPLLKWSDVILDTTKCWKDYQSLPGREEAQQICAWDGWHPILRAHLEMFLGLKKQVEWTQNNTKG